MKKPFIALLVSVPALLALAAFTGCGIIRSTSTTRYGGNYVPFTEGMIKAYSLTPDDIRQLRFYVSRDILVRRDLPDGEAVGVMGRLVADDGRTVDEVAVPQFAEGTVSHVYPNLNLVSVKFSQAAAPLDFVADGNWSHGFHFAMGDRHTPLFADPSYLAAKGSGSAVLLIDGATYAGLEARKHG